VLTANRFLNRVSDEGTDAIGNVLGLTTAAAGRAA
jgi:hypothetical protein